MRCLLVVKASLSLFWLLATLGRFRLELCVETSGCSGAVRTHCFTRKTRNTKAELSPSKEDELYSHKGKKSSLFWWETAGVLPIRCWIYIIIEICCWQCCFSFFFFLLFFLNDFRKKIGSRQTGFLVHTVPKKEITLANVWNWKKTTWIQESV